MVKNNGSQTKLFFQEITKSYRFKLCRPKTHFYFIEIRCKEIEFFSVKCHHHLLTITSENGDKHRNEIYDEEILKFIYLFGAGGQMTHSTQYKKLKQRNK